MIQQPLPRRRFLKLFATAGAVATSASVALKLGGCSESERQLKTHTAEFGTLLNFGETQATTLFALAQSFITHPQDPAQIINVVKRLDEEMYFVKKDISDDFKLALDFLEYLPLAYGRFSRISRMPVKERSDFLNSIQDSSIEPVRVALNACRMATFICYYDQESTWANIGYSGPFSKVPEKLSPQRLHYQKLIKQVAINPINEVLK